jgi:hypothetical protein
LRVERDGKPQEPVVVDASTYTLPTANDASHLVPRE